MSKRDSRPRPFRIGTTSYIIPADMAPNVRFVAGRVDDVELLVLESDDLSPLPTPAVLAELDALAVAHDLTYTVHLPLDIDPGSPLPEIRRQSANRIVRTVRHFESLHPFGYLMHFPFPSWRQASAETVQQWQDNTAASVDAILADGVGPERLCVETLEYPFEWVDGLLERFDLPVCMDVGHLLVENRDVPAALDRYWPRIRILHLHGTADGKDHQALSRMDPALLSLIFSRLAGRPDRERVATIEVFDRNRFEESWSVLEHLL